MKTNTTPPNETTDFMNLYSRQLGVLGVDTMAKLVKLKILICGIDGLGAEIAKNLVLSGPASVHLYDPQRVTMRDLGNNFCFSEDQITRNLGRAEAALPFLCSLNHYVNVRLETDEYLTNLQNFDLVVLCNSTITTIETVSDQARGLVPQVGVIAANTMGLAAVVFVDFGNEFTVDDIDGVNPISSVICNITSKENLTEVHLLADKPVMFKVNEFVQLSEVEGMVELNHLPQPVQVVSTGKFSVILDVDSRRFSPYKREGIIKEVKQRVTLKFEPYKFHKVQPLYHESFAASDLFKNARPEQLHLATQAVLQFEMENGRLPEVRSEEDAQKVVDLAKKLNHDVSVRNKYTVTVDNLDEKIMRFTSYFSTLLIPPMLSFIGGITAQEVLKYTGKYRPYHQFFYFDSFESMRADEFHEGKIPEDWDKPVTPRFSDTTALWGKNMVSQFESQNIFVVGAGALGCEYLKLLALMNMSCKDHGCCHVVDLDNVEVSNLNRQFLFRRHHVGAMKAAVACDSVSAMNPNFNPRPINKRVEEKTEDFFDENFWDSLDIVVNALDNVPSRLYVDSKCVWHEKPLLESGTLGSTANVQVVLPHLTQSYGDSRDPPEESIPLCTLRHFPYQIEHTIEYARDWFEGTFTQIPQEVLQVLRDPQDYIKNARRSDSGQNIERFQLIELFLKMAASENKLQVSVQMACEKFTTLFNHNVAQLLFNFPPEYMNSDGTAFWGGQKRVPEVLSLDINDPLHIEFIHSFTNVMLFVLGEPPVLSSDSMKEFALSYLPQPFQPKKVYIKTSDDDNTPEGLITEKLDMTEVLRNIEALASQKLKITVVVFEKDNDASFHIPLISACSNLRARNYRITQVSNHETKLIAGKIIPAMATTTAMITGLAFMEIPKILEMKNRKLEDFKNAFVNLALPLIVLSEPMGPLFFKDTEYDPVAQGPVKTRNGKFSTWAKHSIRAETGTVAELIEKIHESFAPCEVSIMSIGVVCLYNAFTAIHKERLKTTVLDAYEKITKTRVPPQKTHFLVETSCSDPDDDVDLVIPPIKYQFR